MTIIFSLFFLFSLFLRHLVVAQVQRHEHIGAQAQRKHEQVVGRQVDGAKALPLGQRTVQIAKPVAIQINRLPRHARNKKNTL